MHVIDEIVWYLVSCPDAGRGPKARESLKELEHSEHACMHEVELTGPTMSDVGEGRKPRIARYRKIHPRELEWEGAPEAVRI